MRLSLLALAVLALAAPLAGQTASDAGDFGDDSSVWASDGVCDDTRFIGDRGAGAWTANGDHVGKDATDCRNLLNASRIRWGTVSENIDRFRLFTRCQQLGISVFVQGDQADEIDLTEERVRTMVGKSLAGRAAVRITRGCSASGSDHPDVCGRLPDCKPFLRFVVLPSVPLNSAEPIGRDNGAALRPSRALPLKDGQPSGWPSRTSRTAGRGSHPEGRSGAEDPRERVDGRGWPCTTVEVAGGWSRACGQVLSCVRPRSLRVSHAPRAYKETHEREQFMRASLQRPLRGRADAG